jgi:hypothetical protein
MPQSHAHSDLLSALPNMKCHYAIKSDSSEDESEHTEHEQYGGFATNHPVGAFDMGSERLQSEDADTGAFATDQQMDTTSNADGVAVSLHDQSGESGVSLRKGTIEVRLRTLAIAYRVPGPATVRLHGNICPLGWMFLIQLQLIGLTQKGSMLSWGQSQGEPIVVRRGNQGFRHSVGGYQKLCRVIPDLTTRSKKMANGCPIAAICGKRDPLEHFNTRPNGKVFFAGTSIPILGARSVRSLPSRRHPRIVISHPVNKDI